MPRAARGSRGGVDDGAARAGAVAVVAVLAMGAVQAYLARDAIDAAGFARLDVGDSYLHTDWGSALNAFWSPLYAWLLALGLKALDPGADIDTWVAHAANFGCFLLAGAAFLYLVRRLLEYRTERARFTTAHLQPVHWCVLLVLAGVFAWATLAGITLAPVAPWLLVAGLVFLASGLLAAIHTRAARTSTWAALGAVLALGYLADTMFIALAPVFIAAAAFPVREGSRRAVAAVAAFAVIALPWIVLLSGDEGRFTVGDSVHVSYALEASDVEAPFPGPQPERVASRPPVFRLEGAGGVSEPYGFDPAYWFQGIEAPVSTAGLGATAERAGDAPSFLVPLAPALVLVGLLMAWSAGRTSRGFRFLLLPALAGLLGHGFTGAEPAELAPFAAVGLVGLVFASGPAAGRDVPRRMAGASAALAAVLLCGAVAATAFDVDDRPAVEHRRVAQALDRLADHEPVAVLGTTADLTSSYWARLAQVRVEVFAHVDRAPLPVQVERRALRSVGGTDARAIVARRSLVAGPGWTDIHGTGYRLRLLKP